jgi:hypothetical protein
MSDYWIGLVFSLSCVVVFFSYWVIRLRREHCVRLDAIESRAAADQESFDRNANAREERNERAKAAYAARLAETLHDIGLSDSITESVQSGTLVGTPNGAVRRSESAVDPADAGRTSRTLSPDLD